MCMKESTNENIGDFVQLSLQVCGVFPSPHSKNLLVDLALGKIRGLALTHLSQEGVGLKRVKTLESLATVVMD